MALLCPERVIIRPGRPGRKLKNRSGIVPQFDCFQDTNLSAVLAIDGAVPFSLAVNVEYALFLAKCMDDRGGSVPKLQEALKALLGGELDQTKRNRKATNGRNVKTMRIVARN